MIKELEKIAKGLLVFSLGGLLIAWVLPETVFSAQTVIMSAIVPATMISCTTPMNGQTNSFGTINSDAIYYATTSSTTMESSGEIYMKVYDSGNTTDKPGLWYVTASSLIESPWATDTDATATLSAAGGSEGYGIVATTTGANLVIATRYDYASTSNIVGGLEYGSGAAEVVASSTDPVPVETVYIDYEVTVAVSTPGGTYVDTVTIDCSSS